jgi:hypothetical protein
VAKQTTALSVLSPIERLRQRYEALKGSTERTNCEGHWQEIAEVVAPRKMDFVGIRTPGEKRMSKVFDPTGIMANDMLAAGLHGMATNPATKWFSLRMVGERVPDPETGEPMDINEDPVVKQYLTDVEWLMWQRIYQPGSNFTTALHECYLDLGAFGTSILFVGQRDDGGLMFECRPLAECVIAENHEGRVDTVFRKTCYTVRQMMQMKETDNWTVSDKVERLFKDEKFDETVEVIHAVYPRTERDWSKKDTENMPWASVYFERDEAHQLEVSGFAEFPYLVSRWGKYSGELYGRSPAMVALPDIKMLQAMTLTKIKLLQKAADPPLWLKDDGVVGQTRTVPGGVNYWRGNPNDGVMLQPVSLQGVQYLMQDIQALREQVLRTFYADLLRMADRAKMTATEVVQRTAEQMRLFGPLIGRLESEMLGPMVERIFGILTRQGMLPEAPEAIQDKEFTVEYVSPIATAQKQQAANGVIQVMQLIGMFGPDVAAQIASQNLDINKLFAWAWDLFNNDPDLLAAEETIEQGNQMAQAQQAIGMGVPAADIAAKGAKAIKDISDTGATEGTRGINVADLIAGFQRSPRAMDQAAQMAEEAGADPETMRELTQAQ